MLGLYTLYIDCGRAGELTGLFVEEERVVKKSIGKRVYFGEVLGKHSEIFGTLEKEEVELVSTDQEKIQWLVDTIGSKTISGYNPLNYLSENDEEYEE